MLSSPKFRSMAGPNLHTDSMREKIADILEECRSSPGLESFTSNPSAVTIEEDPVFLTGIVNVIVRVKAADGSTVVAKHSPPYIRAHGEEFPLTPARCELEMTGLQLYQQYSPGSCPIPYFYSRKHNTFLMEDLAGYKSLHLQLLAGNVNKAAIGSLALHLARIHRSTHKDNISAKKWAELQYIFKKYQPVMEEFAEVTVRFPFSKEPHDEVRKQLKEIADSRVFGDRKLNQFVDQYRDRLAHSHECLGRGDNHTRNILVKGDDIKVVDLEFAGLVRCSWEVGYMFSDMIVAYQYHLASSEDCDNHRQIARKIRDCTSHLVDTYIEHMSWDEQHVNNFLKELAADAGFELFLFIGFETATVLGPAQIPLLEATIRLMEQHQVVDSVDKIYSILALE